MWPRILEAGLAAWLGASPFVFGSTGALLLHDIAASAAAGSLAVASLTPRFRRAHFLELPIALWLTGFGWARHELEPIGMAQNHVLLGLTLLMTAILPSEAGRPPPAWRESRGEP